MKRRYIVLAAVNAVSLLIFAVLSAAGSGLKYSLEDQCAAERWAADQGYAQVSVFYEERSAMDINSVFTARVNMEKKLEENSIASEKEGARVWTDAFSTSQKKISVSAGRSSADANLIATGGDFFLFHPMDIISGYYYSDSDVMQDRVLIDNVLAWQLYGASDVTGKPVIINGKYFFISGVFRQSDNSDIEKVYGTSPRIFMSYEGFELLGGETAAFTCYEACLPNTVTGMGRRMTAEVLSVPDGETVSETNPASGGSNSAVVVENSSRYSLKNRFSVMKNADMRSVVDKAIVYPYWENAARITEGRSARLLAAQIFFLMLPTGTVLYFIGKLYHNRKRLLKKAADALKSFFEKALRKIKSISEV